jgi:hypothetical protein
MLDYKHWITKPVAYDEQYVTKDILNLMVDKIHHYVFHTPELEFDYEESSFKEFFYKMMYITYYLDKPEGFLPYNDEMYEYFTMKFSDDIIDIYFDCKELVKQYNIDLFCKIDKSIYLLEFLFNTLLVEDPYNDECGGLSDEENLDYTIDE